MYGTETFYDPILAWHEFLWAHLGVEVQVTIERAGIERIYEGGAVAHADGSYSIGGETFWPDEVVPVRWALVGE